MPFRKITPAEKAEAIALGAVLGADEAGAQLGIDPDSIRRWSKAAGRNPADTIEAPSWQRLGALALARAEKLVAEGKMSAVTLATVAGIAKRNQDKPKPTEDEPPDAALFRWIDERYPSAHERKLAREATEWAIVWKLRALGDVSGDDVTEPDPEAAAALDRELIAILTGTVDLEDYCARHREYADVYAVRERVIGKRAEVLALSGMQMFEACAMAAEISDDHPLPEPLR